jgi:hypothetical protein
LGRDFSENVEAMKTTSRAFFGALLAVAVLSPLAANAVPVTLTLNNPNQVTMAPSLGQVTLIFSGTVTVDPNYHFSGAFFDPAFNNSHTNFLSGQLDAGFAIAWNGTGTYTGDLFQIDVPAGTPADLYSVQAMSNMLSQLYVDVVLVGGGTNGVDGGTVIRASQAYSVLVMNGQNVPENDTTLLLLGLVVAILFFARRMFVLKAWPTTG